MGVRGPVLCGAGTTGPLKEEPMIDYTHQSRIRSVPTPIVTAADAPTVQQSAGRTMRRGEEVSLSAVALRTPRNT